MAEAVVRQRSGPTEKAPDGPRHQFRQLRVGGRDRPVGHRERDADGPAAPCAVDLPPRGQSDSGGPQRGQTGPLAVGVTGGRREAEQRPADPGRAGREARLGRQRTRDEAGRARLGPAPGPGRTGRPMDGEHRGEATRQTLRQARARLGLGGEQGQVDGPVAQGGQAGVVEGRGDGRDRVGDPAEPRVAAGSDGREVLRAGGEPFQHRGQRRERVGSRLRVADLRGEGGELGEEQGDSGVSAAQVRTARAELPVAVGEEFEAEPVRPLGAAVARGEEEVTDAARGVEPPFGVLVRLPVRIRLPVRVRLPAEIRLPLRGRGWLPRPGRRRTPGRRGCVGGGGRPRGHRRPNDPLLRFQVGLAHGLDPLSDPVEAGAVQRAGDPDPVAAPQVDRIGPGGEQRHVAVPQLRDLVVERAGVTRSRGRVRAQEREQRVALRRVPQHVRVGRLGQQRRVRLCGTHHDPDLGSREAGQQALRA